MKTLKKGGAGFIGSNIVKHLIEEGHSIGVLEDLSSGSRSNLDGFPHVDLIEGDVPDAAIINQAMRDVEVMFHLAASVGNKRSKEQLIAGSQINVLGTLNVLEAGRIAKVPKIVFSYTTAIFGELKMLPIREDHTVEPDSPYRDNKLEAEKLCLVYSRLYPLEAICLRYLNVHGINQRFDAYGNVNPIFTHQLLRGEILTICGDGEQRRDFINVRDVARANIMETASAGGRKTWLSLY